MKELLLPDSFFNHIDKTNKVLEEMANKGTRVTQK